MAGSPPSFVPTGAHTPTHRHPGSQCCDVCLQSVQRCGLDTGSASRRALTMVCPHRQNLGRVGTFVVMLAGVQARDLKEIWAIDNHLRH